MTDRALDKAIAERVMGWMLRKQLYLDGKPAVWQGEGNPYICEEGGFRPSSDPAAMLQVIERMRERGFVVSLGTIAPSYKWTVTFSQVVPPHQSAVTKSDEQVGRAVSLAALQAVEPGGGV